MTVSFLDKEANVVFTLEKPHLISAKHFYQGVSLSYLSRCVCVCVCEWPHKLGHVEEGTVPPHPADLLRAALRVAAALNALSRLLRGRADFIGMCIGHLHLGSVLGLTLCCRHLKILNNV